MKKMLAIILILAMALPLTLFTAVNANEELPTYGGYVFFNGERVAFDAAPMSLNGDVYVPLKETAELKKVTVDPKSFTTAKEVNEVTYVTAKEFAKVAGLYFYENKLNDMTYLMDNNVASVDGEYTVWSTPDSKGDTARIILTIEAGKITDVAFDEVRTTGEWKFADGQYTVRWGDRYGIDPDAILAQMIEHLIAKQSPHNWGVDVYTGATSSYNKMADLASAAIAKAKVTTLQPEKPKAYKDGKYEIVGLTDERGYTPVLNMTVQNGEISKVYYDEYTAEGVGKRGTDYVKRWADRYGVDPEAIIANAETQLILNQDPNLVDTLTGATSWGKTFFKLATGALDHAARVDMEVEATYADGLYWVRGAEANGYIPLLKVRVVDGAISQVEFHEVNAETRLSKRYNKTYLDNFATKKEVKPLEILEAMEAKVIETQDFSSVDSISGATGWGNGIKTLGNAALVEASNEVIYVFAGTKTAASAHVVQLLAMARGNELLGVDYKEYQNSNYIPKQDNINYVGPEARWATSKTDELNGRSSIAILQSMLDKFMETKSVDGLDSITGASNWRKGVVELAPRALEWIN